VILQELKLLFVEINVKVNREKLKKLKRISGLSREDGIILRQVPTKVKMLMNALRLYLLIV